MKKIVLGDQSSSKGNESYAWTQGFCSQDELFVDDPLSPPQALQLSLKTHLGAVNPTLPLRIASNAKF